MNLIIFYIRMGLLFVVFNNFIFFFMRLGRGPCFAARRAAGCLSVTPGIHRHWYRNLWIDTCFALCVHWLHVTMVYIPCITCFVIHWIALCFLALRLCMLSSRVPETYDPFIPPSHWLRTWRWALLPGKGQVNSVCTHQLRVWSTIFTHIWSSEVWFGPLPAPTPSECRRSLLHIQNECSSLAIRIQLSLVT
jgi:hypothetical protein